MLSALRPTKEQRTTAVSFDNSSCLSPSSIHSTGTAHWSNYNANPSIAAEAPRRSLGALSSVLPHHVETRRHQNASHHFSGVSERLPFPTSRLISFSSEIVQNSASKQALFFATQWLDGHACAFVRSSDDDLSDPRVRYVQCCATDKEETKSTFSPNSFQHGLTTVRSSLSVPATPKATGRTPATKNKINFSNEPQRHP